MGFMSSDDTQDHGLKIVLEPRTYVAGEHVAGYVELDLSQAEEDKLQRVDAQLHGDANVKFTRTRNHYVNGNSQTRVETCQSTVPLVNIGATLWTAENGYLSQGGQVLRLPFEFQVPPMIPAGTCTGRHSWITYLVEVTGERHGMLHSNRTVAQAFTVQATATLDQMNATAQLQAGWTGPWKTFTEFKEIRRMLWGEHARVQVDLECPALDSYSPGVQIPVVLIVTTTTKTMKKEDTPHDAFAEHPDKALFPAPPSTAADIVFRLDQSLHIYARGEQESGIDEIATLGGFSDANDTSVRVARGEPAWIPDAAKGGDHGHWKRQVFFNTTILLDYAPTIMVQNIACTYSIHIEVPFPGMGNGLKMDVPIYINPGIAPLSTGYAPAYAPS